MLERLRSATLAYHAEHRKSLTYMSQVSCGQLLLGSVTPAGWAPSVLGRCCWLQQHLGHVSAALAVPCSGTVRGSVGRRKQRLPDLAHGLQFGDHCSRMWTIAIESNGCDCNCDYSVHWKMCSVDRCYFYVTDLFNSDKFITIEWLSPVLLRIFQASVERNTAIAFWHCVTEGQRVPIKPVAFRSISGF